MPIDINDNCTGCMACAYKCPKKCIAPIYNNEGFVFPSIQTNVCIKCELCLNNCPILKSGQAYSFEQAYACRRIDDDAYKYASAGVFGCIASHLLKKGFVVAGASFDNDLNVSHTIIDKEYDLQKLLKSKYSQSDTTNIYKEIEKQLSSGNKVLFSGTPCQVAAVNSVFSNQKDSIVTIQVFCHAIPSPLVWKTYLQYLTKKHNASKAVFVDFRHKDPPNNNGRVGVVEYGWKNPIIKIRFDNSTIYQAKFGEDPFINAMTRELITRRSCYDCKFKLDFFSSGADLSIGDFWGIENINSSFMNNSGISAVIVHSKRGQQLLNDCQELEKTIVSLKQIKKGNLPAFVSEAPHNNRQAFFTDFFAKTNNIEAILKNNLGYLANSNKVYLFDLFGSHSLREIINTICIGSHSRIKKHQSNSTIASIISRNSIFPASISLPNNPFRSNMLLADFKKDFFNEKSNNSFFVFDFLEERFDNLLYNNTIITNSDALRETDFHSKEVFNLYEETNLRDTVSKFIMKVLDLYSPDKIIMVENYLVREYGDDKSHFYFDDLDNIDLINEKLFCMYEFIKSNYPFIKTVHFDGSTDLKYCDSNYKHGCFPWHYNRKLYNYLADSFFESVFGGQK